MLSQFVSNKLLSKHFSKISTNLFFSKSSPNFLTNKFDKLIDILPFFNIKSKNSSFELVPFSFCKIIFE